MNTVTHAAELDAGAPLIIAARTETLIIVGDPRVVPASRLAHIASTAQRVMADRGLGPRDTAQLLAPYVGQLITGTETETGLLAAPGRSTV
ncbi:hypothetical protein ACFWP2_20515 [Kitasatospora sp. NPDC058444]|uniref:hypothetical protein n=1 Tax=Kitasatospora sp. NPDC058444 TaxID=3346504 RepID=UPI003669CD1D